ncbi:MAG: hypothetical protein GTN36_06120 [Candidatus Aenigmarchaeota archaeon]|nr:hypothetical protein [Candidatus Aenigmarchaeota archaeon]
MRLMKIIPITLLALVLAATLVRAAHVPEVLLNPSEWAANTERELYLSVKNSNGDNIVKVEIEVPEALDETPIYEIVDVGDPSGWTHNKFTKKIVWTTTGAGIGIGETVEFGFIAISPDSGEYEWIWRTTDTIGGIFAGTSTTKVSAAPVSHFKIFGVPIKTKAGTLLRVTVKAYAGDDTVKTDYTGIISFTSTDPRAILPSDYIFTSLDKGSREFLVTYKTTGDQTFTVTDWTSKITKQSTTTTVEAGPAISMTITPEGSEVSPGNSITFKAEGKDKFDNVIDVTEMTTWGIDSEAGGSWSKNVYTAEKEGIWTVTGIYNSVVDGTTLNVKSGVPPVTPPEEEEEVPEEVPEEEEEEEEEGVPPVEPTGPLEEINIEAEDIITIAPGSNETFIVTVNNVGTTDLTDVSISTMGVPSEWITVYPFKITLEAGTSRDFLIVLSVPENETETKKLDLMATSSEGITTTKSIDINLGAPPTGFVGLSKNLLNLGIVIIAVAALVLIAWELWFRK